MNRTMKKKLHDELSREFETLESLDFGSKEHSAAVEDLAKLYRLAIEVDKSEKEIALKVKESDASSSDSQRDYELKEKEYSLKVQQFEADRNDKALERTKAGDDSKIQNIDRYVKYGLAVAELILPLTFYACWMNRGFRFEETGTFTSTTFRGLFSHFKPSKK